MEHAGVCPTQPKAVGQRVRGEDFARGLLSSLGDLGEDLAVPDTSAILLPAAKAITFQTGDHLVETDLVGSARQFVSAVGTARRADQPGAAKGHQDLVQKRAGDSLAAGDLTALQRPPTGIPGQLQGGSHPVFGFHRKTHSHGGDPRKLIELVKYTRQARVEGLRLRDAKCQREEQRAEDDQRHGGRDQAETA